MPVYGARRTPPPLPPSAVLFDGDYRFLTAGTTYSASVTVPADGAWVEGTAVWNHSGYPYWDCSHSYSGSLSPNANDYAPLFIAGWTPQGICSDQFPVFGCLNCGIDWGGRKAFPGLYMTTNNTPGFMAAGSGTVILGSNNAPGASDLLTLHIEQINRDVMVEMTMFQSVDENDPTPASAAEIADRTFIANSADRVPVVPVLHYGVDANGADRQFPAGPGITWLATWDSGATTVPEEAFAPQGLHGHNILAIPIPKLATGSHSFTVKGALPSGRSYTTTSMTVFVYAQNIYITVEGTFDPRNPQDQSPQFVPGSALSGMDLDLRTTPQMIQVNILAGHGSRGTFDVRVNSSRYPGTAMNFPPGSTDTTPDIDFGGGLTELTGVAIPGGRSPKVVRLPLYVHDYGGWASIAVTMPYRKTTFTTRLRVPADKDGNGLPDAGWRVGPSRLLINSASLRGDEDLDTDPSASGPPPQGILGDGLTAFEEFRGFMIANSYQRLDPARKDLFFVADPDILLMTPFSANSILTTLPHAKHFVDRGEVKMSTSSNPALDNLRPVINSNRAGIPGATEQRAIRMRTRMDAPIFHEDSTGQDFPGHFVALGYTWRDGEDLAIIHEISSSGVASPNGTQVVEVYPLGFDNFAIHYGANNTPDSTVDPYGAPVVYCTNELTDIHCVVNDTLRRVLRRPVQEPQLYAVAGGDDYYTKFGWVTCPLFVPSAAVVMSPAQFLQAHTVVAGHEVGHALHLAHQNSDCTDIMFTLVLPGVPGTNQGPIRHPISDVLPLPTNYGFTAVQGMRLHENF